MLDCKAYIAHINFSKFKTREIFIVKTTYFQLVSNKDSEHLLSLVILNHIAGTLNQHPTQFYSMLSNSKHEYRLGLFTLPIGGTQTTNETEITICS